MPFLEISAILPMIHGETTPNVGWGKRPLPAEMERAAARIGSHLESFADCDQGVPNARYRSYPFCRSSNF
jgi:hypothetical protein